jgi:hypothetical protein
MTIETEVAALTTATTNLTNAVAVQQTSVSDAVSLFAATTATVDNDLNLVDNTADADKPVSDATQASLNQKHPTLVSGVNISTVNGLSLLDGTALVIERGRVEVPVLDYDNRDTLRTPSAPVPITGDVVTIAHLGQFQFSSALEYIDDDEMALQAVDPSDGVTPIGQWVLTLPAYEWMEAQRMFEHADTYEWIEDEELRYIDYEAHHNG